MSYYPKNRVVTNQKAIPGQFIDEDGNEYVGDFFVTFDGDIIAGTDPLNTTGVQLTKVNNIEISNFTGVIQNVNNSRYREINPNINDLPLLDPTLFTPSPTTEDYTRGNITRYFAKQRDKRIFKIIEINKDTYDDLVGRKGVFNYALWKPISLFWRISGPLERTPIEPGVIETNRRIVEQKERIFIGISNYLTNFQEFYK